MLDLSLGSSIFVSDIWEAAIQEIDILFETSNTELIGYPEFGTNFQEYLWTLTPTTQALRDYIDSKLQETTFVSKLNYNVDINYQFDDITYENIYLVKITLYNDFNAVEKTYKLNEKIA